VSEIRFHDLETGQDQAIPNGGAYDVGADVSGDTVVFTRVNGPSSIFTYNVRTQAAPAEVAPHAGSHRRGAVIGHRTVVWQDFSYGAGEPEITAINLDTQALTRLSADSSLDRTPAVSSDGSTVVWSKCIAGQTCDIWQAVAVPGGFTTQALTGAQGDESQPDTNGQVVVYASARLENGTLERDIYWQEVGGGQEYRLALPGVDSNPSISGSLIAFERQDPSSAGPNYDIVLFDLRTQTLYRLTETPQSEALNDISVGRDGLVRVVWSVPENGYDVFSYTFRLPGNPECDPQLQSTTQAEDVCNEPGNHPLVASVMLDRASGGAQEASSSFDATGEGVLCVDNGHRGEPTTAGWVQLNGSTVVEPSRFRKDGTRVAQEVTLSGASTLAARIAGSPGSSFRVRLYGPPPACASHFPWDELIPGRRVEPQAWSPPAEDSPEILPEQSGGSGFGCNLGGDSSAWLVGVLVAGLLWSLRRQPAPARQSRARAR
jgi:MYXO-CTERM domain-containing protein